MRPLSRPILALLPLALVACGDKGGPKKPQAPHEEHVAPHGGEVLELGDHEAHLELIHDHTGGNVTVYVYEADFKTPILVPPPKVVIATKDGPQEFTLTAIDPKPDGTSAAWKGSHPGLVADPWDGRIRVTIRGKELSSPLEGEAHTHK